MEKKKTVLIFKLGVHMRKRRSQENKAQNVRKTKKLLLFLDVFIHFSKVGLTIFSLVT